MAQRVSEREEFNSLNVQCRRPRHSFIHSTALDRKFCVLCLPYIVECSLSCSSLCIYIHIYMSHSHNRKAYDYYLLKMLVMLFYYLRCCRLLAGCNTLPYIPSPHMYVRKHRPPSFYY